MFGECVLTAAKACGGLAEVRRARFDLRKACMSLAKILSVRFDNRKA